MDYQEVIERYKDSDKDKCTGCFGAANNDCSKCIREEKSRGKSNSEWTDMIMRRFMLRE